MNPESGIRFLTIPDDQDAYALTAEYIDAHVRQYTGDEPVPELELYVSGGSKLKDLQQGPFYLYTVTSRVKEVFELCQVSGIRTVPYNVVGTDLVKVVHRLVVLGRCSGVEFPSSEETLQIMDYGNRFLTYFDLTTWDGSDVFFDPIRQVHTFLSDRAVKCLRKNGVKLPVDADGTTDYEEYKAQLLPGKAF